MAKTDRSMARNGRPIRAGQTIENAEEHVQNRSPAELDADVTGGKGAPRYGQPVEMGVSRTVQGSVLTSLSRRKDAYSRRALRSLRTPSQACDTATALGVVSGSLKAESLHLDSGLQKAFGPWQFVLPHISAFCNMNTMLLQ